MLQGNSTITDLISAAAQACLDRGPEHKGPVQVTFKLGDHVFTIEMSVVKVDDKLIQGMWP